MPTLSIITINLNNAAGLRKTAHSVVGQYYTDFEYIIIDGGSTDGSQQVIHDYKDKISHWLLEPDTGIYNAMNKGIRLATGEYCLFLNAGDWLAEPQTLQSVFSNHYPADIIAGDIYYYDNQRSEIKWLVTSPDQLTAKTLFSGTLPHQATFIRRRLFETIGLYNEQLKIASDWLFFIEALLVRNCTYQHHTGVVSFFNMDGVSCAAQTNFLPRQEQLAVLHQKYPRFLPDYEQLSQLENQAQQWINSREYRVYTFMKQIGMIQAGIVCRRVKRFLLTGKQR